MSKSEEVGTFGQSEVLAVLKVVSVAKHEDTRLRCVIDGRMIAGSAYEVVELDVPYTEETEKIRVGNASGALVIPDGSFKLHVQDPKLFGKFKAGAVLHLIADVGEVLQ
jgi:hypothetical protein